HFNQPTDVAFDSAGNIYITDGYGNSRVLKFDKYGKFLLTWGTKGSGPGQFDLPHTIAIDEDLIYVGDRENARIQIFDTSGHFIKEWKNLGHPYGLFITPEHFIFMADGEAGTVLKINRDGQVLGTYSQQGPQRALAPHAIAVDKDNSIFIAEV